MKYKTSYLWERDKKRARNQQTERSGRDFLVYAWLSQWKHYGFAKNGQVWDAADQSKWQLNISKDEYMHKMIACRLAKIYFVNFLHLLILRWVMNFSVRPTKTEASYLTEHLWQCVAMCGNANAKKKMPEKIKWEENDENEVNAVR